MSKMHISESDVKLSYVNSVKYYDLDHPRKSDSILTSYQVKIQLILIK